MNVSRNQSSAGAAVIESSGSPGLDSLIPAQEGAAVLRRVTLRLIPLLFICYVIAYIDRINVGFAKLHLQPVLGVDPKLFGSVFGFGAGLFFIGYFIFEVPSNLILHRVGARIWIARILVLWGIVSMAFMFLKGVTSFYVLRFLLGAAEAGFFPGIILYLTFWYPPRERAQMIALFALGGVAAGVIGSPISGAILQMDGLAGLAGWQWLFFLEAVPAILLGVLVWWILPDSPEKASWLTANEKEWIRRRIADGTGDAHATRNTLADCFTSPVVWILCLLYFLMNVGSYGYEMWLPSIVKALSGKGDAVVGFINAVPYFVAGAAMYFVSRHSDKTNERRAHIAVSAISATIGFAIAATARNPYVAMAGLTLAFAGLKSTIAPFWAWTSGFLSGTAAAGGIALINSVGNLGGFFGPTFVGILKDKTGSNFSGLLLLGACLLAMGVLAFAVPHRPPLKDPNAPVL
jgi:ACS family tartrate transporter-like MFS transporter